MKRLYVALLEPDLPSPPATQVAPEQEVSPEAPSRQFIRPVRPSVTRRSLTELAQTDVQKRLVRFGVIVESFDEKIVSEVVRDVLNLVASLPSNSRLVVASPNSGPFWQKLCSSVPVDFQVGGFENVSTWKMYWANTKPAVPKGIRPQFEKFVGEVRKKISLKPGHHSPMPVNPDANRMLPNNFNPMFRRQPTLAPVTMTPQLYLWSSRSPAAGEKVLEPSTEAVESIVSIAGAMAKIGSDHRMLNMEGYEFFQPLDLWAPRAYKKDEDGSKD